MPRFRSRFVLIAAVATAGIVGCARAAASAADSPAQQGAPTPKLVLFITVDQFRGDYPVKFGAEYKAGLKRLTQNGAWFTNGFQDHGITETAPGHASTMSGRFPRSTGITSNTVGVIDSTYKLYSADPREVGASPFRFQGTTLYDWLAAKKRRSRALSVSMKDRGAILPIGRAKQDVYWYSISGSFTTSNYYRSSLPSWVTSFNDRKIPGSYAGKSWSLSHEDSYYSEKDDVKNENGGRNTTFPHMFGTNAESTVRTSPMMDSIVALFALEALRQTGIGQGPQTDVMAVSFSATDYIGHSYGPDSREVHENQLRLDETIGWFLDSLYKLRDSASIVIAMTGDHGVSPNPELARERGEATGDQGLRVSLRQVVADTKAGLQAARVSPDAFIYDGELIGMDRAAITKARLKPDSILDAFAAAARNVPGISRVDRMSKIYSADTLTDPVARRWAHQIPNPSNVEMVITLTNYSYWSATTVATHGSPYDRDAWVPIVFYGAGVKPGKYTTFARTVDMGATLAAILNVKPLEKLDGVALKEAIR